MIEGTYTFWQDGKILGEAHNLITTAGKVCVLNYLAKYTNSIADYIAVGTGTVAATVSDLTLGFEFARSPVSLIAADYSTTGIIFKGILPITVVGTISEAGLWTAPTSGTLAGSRMLTQFDSTDLWSSGVSNADATKVGGDALRVTATVSSTTTTTLTGAIMDLSQYTSADRFLFAYNVNDANNSSIKLRFKVDVSNYYEITLNGANVTSGYHIVSLAKASFAATGTPTWAGIQILEIAQTAGGGGTNVCDYDGIRVESLVGSPDNVLVSRAVLAAPIAKTNVRPMELEYRLRVTV